MQKGKPIINPFMKKEQNNKSFLTNDDSPQAIDMDTFNDNFDYLEETSNNKGLIVDNNN